MTNFPIEKLGSTRKPTEASMLRELKDGLVFGPLKVRSITSEMGPKMAPRVDALAEATWGTTTTRFGVEIKTGSEPRLVEAAMHRAISDSEALGVHPMIFVPYLGDESLRRIEARGVSGIDLCGNAVVQAPGVSLWRSGAPNRYPSSRPLRNPYQGDSSIFARCFILQPTFESLTDLRDFALNRSDRSGTATEHFLLPSTASKAVQALADDLVVSKEGGLLRLLDAQRLLTLIRERYRGDARPVWIGKTSCPVPEIWSRLAGARKEERLRSAVTGLASAAHYGVLSGVDRLSLYVDDAEVAVQLLEGRPGRAFANLEIIEDRKELLFWDNRVSGGAHWASPIQTWLELAQGGPREREAAETMERRLLSTGGAS